MNYSSLEFLLLFPLYCALYWAVRRQGWRLGWILLGSVAFYAYGDPAGLPVLIGVGVIGFAGGLVARPGRAHAAVAAGTLIAALVAALAAFKYAGPLLAWLGAPGPTPLLAAAAPLGVSFFTFEAIAYIADVRRGVAPVERSMFRYSLYVTLFPHLIAGPIMRPNDLFPQLTRRIRFDSARFASGLQLFVEGLIKKRLLADPAGLIVDRVFAFPAGADPTAAWLGALAYTVQIYGDFAGYTDMGRGIARMLGFELPLNFNAPYTAASIGDFWRRWHISLSSWLRDYLYIPLGGNRRGSVSVNVLVTMLLGGLWHGAGLTFLLWGGYHGLLLVVERRLDWGSRLPAAVRGALTLFLVVNGWVLFRSRDLATWWSMVGAMYGFQPGRVLPTRDVAFVVAAFAIVVALMVASRVVPRALEATRRPAVGGLAYAAGVAAVVFFAPTGTVPFIYFRF